MKTKKHMTEQEKFYAEKNRASLDRQEVWSSIGLFLLVLMGFFGATLAFSLMHIVLWSKVIIP